jgi:glycosyltransferase involved in cell wall biosynthesis
MNDMDYNSQKVSVIIPVYNSQEFLTDSIESALNQTYKNIEIIAVDDGSTDNSLPILKKFGNKITIISQENKGLAGALNTGIENMTGNWAKLLSADDVLYPDAIEVLVNEIKKLPENTIVYSNWDIIDDNNRKLRTFSESNYNDLENFDFNVRLLDGQQININTTLMPSSLFTSGCLIEKLDDPVAIDYDFFLRAGILFDVKFHLIPKSLIQYRVHGSQLSHKKILKTLSYLSVIRDLTLSKLDKSQREEYLAELRIYNEKKSVTQKTKEIGLKIMGIMPEGVSDKILVFYLNKVRTTR